jgi:hypothetical protein
MPQYWLSSQILLPKQFPVAPVVRCGNPQCAATVLRGGLFQLRPIRFPARGVGRERQAALARRIRRRRSEARSSSFRPPQVPYFSGLEMA